jgi:hypothetical protein
MPCLRYLFFQGHAILSSAGPSSSFEVVAHIVSCGLVGYSPDLFGNGQWWANRNGAQIPRFAKSLCVCNYAQCGWDRPQSHSSKPCGNNSENLCMEWVVPGLCTGCLTRATQSPTHLAIEHWTRWLWLQSEWSPPALWSGTNESLAWLDEPSEHHSFDDIPHSGVLGTTYEAP